MSRIEAVRDDDDVMTLEAFAEAVRERWLIDYDGHAHPSDGKELDGDVWIKPSIFRRSDLAPRWSHVVWYNR